MAGTSYDLVGTGPHTVIALHGWFGDKGGWGPIRDMLDGEAFRYAFMDYRGYGDSQALPGEHTIAEIAADALWLADELGCDTFSLLGHSMGGQAIQQVYADAPDRVRALVGISPIPASGVPFDDDGWALFSGAANSADNRRAIIDLTTGNRLSGRWLDQLVAYSLEHSDPQAVGDYLNSWARTDIHERIQGSTIPALVIAGDQDPSLGPQAMRDTWLRWYENVRLEVLPDAGHYGTYEAPVRTVTLVEDFLRTVPAA